MMDFRGNWTEQEERAVNGAVRGDWILHKDVGAANYTGHLWSWEHHFICADTIDELVEKMQEALDA